MKSDIKIPTYKTSEEWLWLKHVWTLSDPCCLALPSGPETPFRAWRNEDGDFRSKGFWSLSPSFLLPYFCPLSMLWLSSCTNYLETSWHSPFLASSTSEEAAFVQCSNKGAGRKVVDTNLCVPQLFFVSVMARRQRACCPRTPPFSDRCSMSQALEPVLGSQHLFWASDSPESVAQSTEPWPKVLQLHMGYGTLIIRLPPSTIGSSVSVYVLMISARLLSDLDTAFPCIIIAFPESLIRSCSGGIAVWLCFVPCAYGM